MNIKGYGYIRTDRTFGEEWTMVDVDPRLRAHCFEVLELDRYGYRIPDYSAHISLFDREETASLPIYFPEEGRLVKFTISGVKTVAPDDWDGVGSCFIMTVNAPALSSIREKYGFTPLMHGDHEFHITIGIAEKEPKGLSTAISVFNKFIEDGM